MLTDVRTWSTLAYRVLMLPLGIVYVVAAVTGLSISVAFIVIPFIGLDHRVGVLNVAPDYAINPVWLGAIWFLPSMLAAGVLSLTLLMHLARGVGRLHAMFAKALLVAPVTPHAG